MTFQTIFQTDAGNLIVETLRRHGRVTFRRVGIVRDGEDEMFAQSQEWATLDQSYADHLLATCWQSING